MKNLLTAGPQRLMHLAPGRGQSQSPTLRNNRVWRRRTGSWSINPFQSEYIFISIHKELEGLINGIHPHSKHAYVLQRTGEHCNQNFLFRCFTTANWADSLEGAEFGEMRANSGSANCRSRRCHCGILGTLPKSDSNLESPRLLPILLFGFERSHDSGSSVSSHQQFLAKTGECGSFSIAESASPAVPPTLLHWVDFGLKNW